jgi:lactoylglutathione lyase
MPSKPRLVGINHVALEVGSIEDALAFYGDLFALREVEREPGMAFLDMGDQFVALSERAGSPPDDARHFGLVVDDKQAVRAALERMGVEMVGAPRLDFRDPWGNLIQVVQYSDIQFTKTPEVLTGIGLQDLHKTPGAVAELRAKGIDHSRRERAGAPAVSNDRLRALAERVAHALPDVAEEIVLTGSVSRGMADAFSDIEMLVITGDQLSLERCMELAGGAGLKDLDSWGPGDPVERRVSGSREGVPLELIWWSRSHAEERIDALLHGQASSAADALVYGVVLRTVGLLAGWQERLAAYPESLVIARVEEAAVPWGGFSAAGVLTLTRPGDRLALTEWLVDGARRVLTIVFAVNRVWQPTSKRLSQRVAALAVTPDRMAERIEDALLQQDARHALLVMTELQLDAVRLAPSGPGVERARVWLAEALELLRTDDHGM